MNSRPASGMWYREVRPGARQRARLDEELDSGRTAVMHTHMEVLDVNDRGVALLWVTDPEGVSRPRLAAATLPVGLRAELLMAQGCSRRVQIIVEHHVIGRLPGRPGSYGAIVQHPEGRLAAVAGDPVDAQLMCPSDLL